MKHVVAAALVLAATTLSAHAVTTDNGVVIFTQADAIAGNVTPGDAPGFPVTISVTGSYRLGSSFLVATAVNGIEVTAPEVSIDLAGFRIAGSGVGRNGITSFQRALSLRNGTVRGFSLDGVRTVGGALLVEDMRLMDNGRYGVNEDSPATAASFISRNIITGNQFGVRCAKVCLIEANVISNNSGIGVSIPEPGSSILGNTISYNGTYGVNADALTSFGNNAIVGNSLGSTTEAMQPLHPNVCFPQAC